MSKISFICILVLLSCATINAQTTSFTGSWGIASTNTNGVEENSLSYELRGDFNIPVFLAKTKKATTIENLLDDYPSKWIEHYHSIEIAVTTPNGTRKAMGTSPQLNLKQKELLQELGIGDKIHVLVNYSAKNASTNEQEKGKLETTLTVVPENSASYIGGKAKWHSYYATKFDKLIGQDAISTATIRFTVNTRGEIENVVLVSSSGLSSIDKNLLEAVKLMPRWQAAQNNRGESVSQNFLLIVQRGGC